MGRTIGVLAAEHIAAGVVEGDELVGSIATFPEADDEIESLVVLPADEIAEAIAALAATLGGGEEIEAVGVGVAGVARDGTVLEAPNLPQIKGHDLAASLTARLADRGVKAPVLVLNDADATAAGVAARAGQLDRFIRVWTLGLGIGFGRYPHADGVWEGGHTTVSLDPKETYCGCGGVGHVEGVMGHRAMRLRFLDLEPDEIFERAVEGDTRCVDFVTLWHRALAAATATSVHMEGPGKFFVCGRNAKYARLDVLYFYLHDMVKMSSLQDTSIEVVSAGDEVAVLGAAINARRAAGR